MKIPLFPDNAPDDESRRPCFGAAAPAAGAELVATTVPFVAALAPNEIARALGAPISDLPPHRFFSKAALLVRSDPSAKGACAATLASCSRFLPIASTRDAGPVDTSFKGFSS